MRFTPFSILLLACAGSMALAAQVPTKKKGDSPAPTKATSKSDASADDDAPSDDKGAGDADQVKKPAKPSSKKGPGLKITTVDETELLKKLSYMQGYGTGKTMKVGFEEQGVVLDDEVLLAAFKDALAGKEPEITEDEMTELFPQIQKMIAAKANAKLEEVKAENKAEGEAFLAANKKKEGVKTLSSGLQYKVLKSGKGLETPKRSDTVKAHYKGSFLNGTEFESSYKNGAPASFPVSRVIKGWTEALQLMKVGDKWQLFVPSALAYGEEGRRDPQSGRTVIAPNATLIFEVELLGVEKGSKLPPPSLK